MAGPGPDHRGPGSPGAAGGVEGAGPHRGALWGRGRGRGPLRAPTRYLRAAERLSPARPPPPSWNGASESARGGARTPGSPSRRRGAELRRVRPKGAGSSASLALPRRRGNRARHGAPLPRVGPAPTSTSPRDCAPIGRGARAGRGAAGAPWRRRPGGAGGAGATRAALAARCPPPAARRPLPAARRPLPAYLGVGYAGHAALAHVLPQPALRGSPWCPVRAAAFNLVVLLLLASHARAVPADPGERPPVGRPQIPAEPRGLAPGLGRVLAPPPPPGCWGGCPAASRRGGRTPPAPSPGTVPLPDTAIDFSDLRSAPRKPERSQEGWTVGDRCEAHRPPRAHRCRVCHRCVRRRDHRCPWINNCVGELNQKYFVQFLFYAGLASLYAAGLVLATWLGLGGRSPAGMAAEGDIANNRIQTAHCIVLLLESLLFGAFVAVVFYDQVMSIITDKTPLEQLYNRGLKETNCEGPHPPKPKLALLWEVFGRGFVLCWLFPGSCSPTMGAGPVYSPLPSHYV
ncbi:LOW QUALITY PROTEIN: uncharacterized protein M6G45_015998 [Spheniscus humboldti]